MFEWIVLLAVLAGIIWYVRSRRISRRAMGPWVPYIARRVPATATDDPGNWAFRLGAWLRRTNNNRLKAMWIIVIVWFLWNSMVIGVGPSAPEPPKRHPYFPHIPLPAPEASDVLESIWETYGTLSWAFWFFWVAASILYVPIAFRDEVAMAFRRATRVFRERRGETQQVRVVPQPGDRHAVPQPAAGSGGLTLRQYLTFEFITDFLQELIAHRIFSGGR